MNVSSLRERIAGRLRSTLAAYGRSCADGDVERALSAALPDGRAEFAHLDEALQEKVILRVARSRSAAGEIEPAALAPGAADAGTPARNRALLRATHGPAAYGARLLAAYGALLTSPIEPRLRGIDPVILLDRFLAPESFLLLRA